MNTAPATADRTAVDHQPCSPGVVPCRVEVSTTNQVEAILAEVARRTCITEQEILGKSHLRPIVQARHEVWRRVRAELGWSYPMIGKRFAVDHTTVMSALGAKPRARKVVAA